jgi:5-methylcytosine-specific restriction protein A
MSTLSDIEPKNKQRLIDLVKAAGVDVSAWAYFKGGEANASKNPKYCFEWAFVQPGRVVVLTLWHESMKELPDGAVFLEWNYRAFALERKGHEGLHARRADEAIQAAVNGGLQLRVIVVAGRRRDITSPSEPSNKPDKRMLDPVPWLVSDYDAASGNCRLTRGVGECAERFLIQQEPAQEPKRHDISGQVFVRSAVVRSNVRLRAGGKCEYCHQPSFVMANGGVYLETHHVTPLSENGPDNEKNVSALCPNHHREAHHGKNKNDIQADLLERLRQLYH